MEVASHAPFLSVENLRVQISPIIQIDVAGEFGEAKHLWLREWVLVVQQYLPLEMLLELFDIWSLTLVCSVAPIGILKGGSSDL